MEASSGSILIRASWIGWQHTENQWIDSVELFSLEDGFQTCLRLPVWNKEACFDDLPFTRIRNKIANGCKQFRISIDKVKGLTLGAGVCKREPPLPSKFLRDGRKVSREVVILPCIFPENDLEADRIYYLTFEANADLKVEAELCDSLANELFPLTPQFEAEEARRMMIKLLRESVLPERMRLSEQQLSLCAGSVDLACRKSRSSHDPGAVIATEVGKMEYEMLDTLLSDVKASIEKEKKNKVYKKVFQSLTDTWLSGLLEADLKQRFGVEIVADNSATVKTLCDQFAQSCFTHFA